MITVDCISNRVIIQDPESHLQPIHISQLRFWQFSNDVNDNVFNSPEIDYREFLPKIVKYIAGKGLQYQLTPAVSTLLANINLEKDSFQDLKVNAQNYKEGKFDRRVFQSFKSFLSSALRRPLLEHQEKAAYHLYQVGNGANFSVPGSGKTSVVLSVYEKLKSEGKVNTLFVVGPPACFGPWKNEFETVLGRRPKTKILAGEGKNKRKKTYAVSAFTKSELYLTTFQTLLYDRNEVRKLFAQVDINVFLVIDEAHYIKRINGEWSNAVLSIGKLAKYRCILTGTPLPKSFADAFNLFDFLWPESYPISNADKARIRVYEQRKEFYEARRVLQQNVGPLFYRVRKRDLGLKDQIFVDPILVEMNDYERKVYDAIENKIRNYARDEYLRNIQVVESLAKGRIIRLQQAASYTSLLQTGLTGYRERLIDGHSELAEIIRSYSSLEVPAKLTKLLQLVGKFRADNKKVVIWANYIGVLELIVGYLRANGFKCELIYGGTPIEKTSMTNEKTREKIRDEFVSSSSGLDILVANPAACSESISLHKTCQNAIYYNLTYNCAQYLQSLDRIHRVGGSEQQESYYYFLQYSNTIEQDIKINVEQKAERMYAIIEQDYEIYNLDLYDEVIEDEVEAYNRLFQNKDSK